MKLPELGAGKDKGGHDNPQQGETAKPQQLIPPAEVFSVHGVQADFLGISIKKPVN